MATNPLTQRLIDQIPKEADRLGPAARPAAGIHSSEVGRQVFNTAMALPGAGGLTKAAGTGGMISRAFNATAGAANRLAAAGVGVVGASATADELMPARSFVSTAPQLASTSASGPSALATPASSPNSTSNAQMPSSSATGDAEQISYDAATKTYSGHNVAAGAQIMNGRGGGAISAQNMGAADQLSADQNLASVTRVANSGSIPNKQQGGMIGRVTATHSGNDWTTREALRRAKMDANSLIHQSHWAKKGSGQAAQKAHADALQSDISAMTQGQTGADVEVMRQNAGLQREGLQQAGADRRDHRRSLVDAARLGMDQETQGFANRAASQQEQLRNTLLDPNATPEQRAMAQRSLAALSGKTAADRMQTVTLPDTTTDMGTVVRGGQALVRVLEDGTVQQVPVTAQAQGLPPGMTRQVGTSGGKPVYEDAQGKRFTGG